MAKQEVWVFDIETKPLKAYVWDRYNVNIGLEQIIEDQSILAWSAKRLNDPKSLVYKDLRSSKNYCDDKALLLPLWNILDKADIVITQNGTEFDSKRVNARFIEHGMSKPSDYRHFDILVLARRIAAFTSTKLEYITAHLNVKYKKLSHSKYPGWQLWVECLNGNQAAWREMERYNINDTLSTEEAALRLKEWAPKAFPDWDDEKCDVCGKVKKLKIKCQDCGTWRNK